MLGHSEGHRGLGQSNRSLLQGHWDRVEGLGHGDCSHSGRTAQDVEATESGQQGRTKQMENYIFSYFHAICIVKEIKARDFDRAMEYLREVLKLLSSYNSMEQYMYNPKRIVLSESNEIL